MRKLTLALGIGLLFVNAGLLNAGDKEAFDKALKESEGTWKVVSREAYGRSWTKEELKDQRLVSKGNKWTFYNGEEVRARGTRSVVSVKDGVRKTVIKTESGRTFKNIAKMKGDTLTTCRVRADSDFPKTFSSKNGILTVYQRVKLDKE